MEIKFYGVRGSLPTPKRNQEFKDFLQIILDDAFNNWKKHPDRFSTDDFIKSLPPFFQSQIGGETTCALVTSEKGEKIIIDCGTGIRNLGNDLFANGFLQNKERLSILITHTHWDHIQGWPFFKPAYIPGAKIDFYSCIENLEERFERQQHPENFPISLSLMASEKNFFCKKPLEKFTIGSLEITPFALKHPGNSTGYRIQENDKTLVFCTDVEVTEADFDSLTEMKNLMGAAEILVIDSQYNSEEAKKKVGWGHTSTEIAVRSADILGVETLVLTHHEPDHTDPEIHKIYDEALTHLPTISKKIKIHLAYEGDSYKI